MRLFDYSKLAEKAWDNDILNLVARIHEAKGKQDLFVRQKHIELDRLVEIARIQSTESSNRIEGIITTSIRLKELFKGKTSPRNRDEKEIIGYRDVLNTIHESYEYISIKPTYILQLHRDLLKKSGLSFSGQFKNVQNYIAETKKDGTVAIRFTPVSPFEALDSVEKLCNAYEIAIANEKVDSLLLIPIFICDFLCIHPFNDGNGRMSRLLTLLLLYKSGYSVGRYISIEKQIEKTKELYYDALQHSDLNWHEGKNDPTHFIRYMLQIILACYMELEERVGLLSDDKLERSAYELVKDYALNKIGAFKGVDVILECPRIGRSSALSALKKLTEEGFVIRKGSGRSIFYIRADSK